MENYDHLVKSPIENKRKRHTRDGYKTVGRTQCQKFEIDHSSTNSFTSYHVK